MRLFQAITEIWVMKFYVLKAKLNKKQVALTKPNKMLYFAFRANIIEINIQKTIFLRIKYFYELYSLFWRVKIITREISSTLTHCIYNIVSSCLFFCLVNFTLFSYRTKILHKFHESTKTFWHRTRDWRGLCG